MKMTSQSLQSALLIGPKTLVVHLADELRPAIAHHITTPDAQEVSGRGFVVRTVFNDAGFAFAQITVTDEDFVAGGEEMVHLLYHALNPDDYDIESDGAAGERPGIAFDHGQTKYTREGVVLRCWSQW